jgi:hypothetical protein
VLRYRWRCSKRRAQRSEERSVRFAAEAAVDQTADQPPENVVRDSSEGFSLLNGQPVDLHPV